MRPTHDPRTDTVRDAEGHSAAASPGSPRPPNTLSALLPDPFPIPRLIDDRYEVRARIGAGGHGAVYRVYDRVFRHDVALKVLQDASRSETLRARFRREAEVAHRLVHPNLLRVFELCADGPFVYFTMELVEGESLAQRLRERGALPMDEALRITEHLLEGLAHLHTSGLLHRDIKPSNVLLDHEGHVKVADLGLVLPLDEEQTRLTMTEALLGTLAYLSPEQALNQPPTPASDLYAVGLVLYEMLAGKPPYESGSSLGLLLQRMSRPPATLRVLRPDLPVWLHRVVERLLEPRPELRYPKAEEVLEDLRRKQASLSPRRRRQRRRLSLVGAGVFAAATALWAWISASTELDAEMMSLPGLVDVPGNAGLTVIGADGKDLWHAPELELRRTALGWLQPDQPPVAFALAVDPLGGPARLELRSAWTGAGATSVDRTITISPALTGAISLGLSPTSLTINPGSNGTTSATITRTSYTGSVTLTVPTTLPSGVTTTITSPGTGTLGSVRFNVATNGALFTNYPVTIRASGSGVTSSDRTINISRAQ